MHDRKSWRPTRSQFARCFFVGLGGGLGSRFLLIASLLGVAATLVGDWWLWRRPASPALPAEPASAAATKNPSKEKR